MEKRTGNPEQGRRTASRATKLRRRKQRMNFILLAGAVAALLLLIFEVPKWITGSYLFEPLHRATYSSGTESGLVENTGNEHVGEYAGLVISEVMPANATAVTDENGKFPDWLEVWNSTDHRINLKGIGLSDKGDRIRFLFPAVSLEPDGRVTVFCDNTNQANPDRPFHAKFQLSSVGETIYLFDPNSYLIDSVKYSFMDSDESWALVGGGYEKTAWFSPGFENTEAGHLAYRESVTAADGSVLINEVMADPLTGIRDDEGELCDWIELYNTTGSPINLDKFALSDNEGKPLKWRFPDNAVIPAHGYYIVLCTGKNRMDSVRTDVPHTNFRISAEKETIILADSQGRVVDRVMIDNLPQDCSWGRNEQNQMQVFQVPTPTLPNNQSGFNQMDLNLRAMNRTGVWISEVLASNNQVSTYAGTENKDWVEIYNSSDETVDISYWGLSDNQGRARKWQFPAGTLIAPGEYKVILCDRNTAKGSTAEPHTSFRIGRNAGEVITLADPAGNVLDKIVLPEMKTDISYGRTLGIAGLFYYETPTPFRANGTGFNGFAPKPSFSVEPGLYYTTQYVEILVPEGTQVFYTTDGSNPTQMSTPYTEGERLELNQYSNVLRARAFSTGLMQPSEIITGTWFVNVYHALPVVSVVTDPDNLWDEERGLLSVGPDAVKVAGKLPFKNTVYRKLKDAGVKYECYVEMYDDSNNRIISQGAEFCLMGAYSLDMPQKSFRFTAKSAYGPKTFEAKLFEDRDYTEYKSFVLRNSGNDCMFTRMADGFQNRLIDLCGGTIAHQAWKPYSVYLNGIYWGHMNLRERADRFMVAQFEGLTLEEADEMDLLQASGSVKFGSNKEYKAMVKKIKAGNPAQNEDDLQYILDNVDVDNLFEYLSFEMFFGNSDIGNTRFYRLKREGSKWRWLLYDLDYGMFSSSFNSPWSYTKPKGMGEQKIDNTIFLKLLSVREYKERFLTVFGQVFQKLTTPVMLDELNKTLAIIEPEMKNHWARWGEENDKMVISDVPVTSDGALRYWEKRVERLRNTCRKRPTLLWGYAQDAFNLTDEQMKKYFGPKPEMPADAV